MKAIIKLNQNTKNHASSLKNLGYQAEVVGDEIVTEVEGFVAHLDLVDEKGPEALMEVIASKKALTYGTKVTMFDEKSGEVKVYTSVPMCLKLGAFSKRMGLPDLSCLVMKGDGKGRAPAAEVPRNWAAFAQFLGGTKAAPAIVSESEEAEDV